jgi:hypothetical protein
LHKPLDKNGRPSIAPETVAASACRFERQLAATSGSWKRVVLERDVVLIDRRINQILDIIENVIGLASGR